MSRLSACPGLFTAVGSLRSGGSRVGSHYRIPVRLFWRHVGATARPLLRAGDQDESGGRGNEVAPADPRLVAIAVALAQSPPGLQLPARRSTAWPASPASSAAAAVRSNGTVWDGVSIDGVSTLALVQGPAWALTHQLDSLLYVL